ncbi:MAG TPA: T9SS type A sorting domain-containing protein [Bacteroidales bacterium]|nr:T9SS type A sorting domain-containing protein [Bacteroidales bacterium]HSA42965.1 T9SS type A sorting domain-containing protein [Bacteroidales bacterium]
MKKTIFILPVLAVLWISANAQQIITSIPHKIAYPGTVVSVPVQVQNFSGVASISLTMDYLNASLSYQNYQNLHPSLAGSFFVNVQPGSTTDRLAISWFSLTPSNIGNGTLMELVFNYTGGTTPLTWDTLTWGNCQYTDLDGLELPASFISGSVSPIQPNTTSLPEVFGIPANDLLIPLTVNDFNNVGQLHLTFGYDPAVLTYQSVNQVHPALNNASFTAVASNGVITLDWTDMNPANIGDDTMCVLKFSYTGNCPLTWDTATSGACYYKDINGNNLPANFINGSVASSLIQLNIASVSLCNGAAITLPVSASNIHQMASFSLELNYDTAVLKNPGYQNLHPDLAAGLFTLSLQGNTLHIDWSSTNELDIPSAVLFELTFTSPVTGGGYSNMIWQASNSTFLNLNNVNIPCNYVGGTVNMTPFINLGPDQEVCHYDTAVLFAGANFASYLWSTGDTSNTIVVDSSMGAGFYSVTVTDVLGCTGHDDIYLTFTPCIFVEEYDAGFLSFTAMPNPSAGGMFQLDMNSLAGNYTFQVIDLYGNICMQNTEKTHEGNWMVPINLSGKPAGLYVLRIISSYGIKQLKLIIN